MNLIQASLIEGLKDHLAQSHHLRIIVREFLTLLLFFYTINLYKLLYKYIIAIKTYIDQIYIHNNIYKIIIQYNLKDIRIRFLKQIYSYDCP